MYLIQTVSSNSQLRSTETGEQKVVLACCWGLDESSHSWTGSSTTTAACITSTSSTTISTPSRAW